MALSQFLLVLVAAAAAFSLAEFVSGPLLFRVLINREAVSRWLWSGLERWDSSETLSWWQRVGLWPVDKAKLVNRGQIVDGQLSDFLNRSSSVKPHPLDDLVNLATGGRSTALFRLDGDHLAAQINAAAEAALDRPGRYRVLLVALAKIDREEVLSVSSFQLSVSSLQRFLQTDTLGTNPDKDLIASRHEVSVRIQRRLDDLQITTRSYQAIAHLALCITASIATVFVLGTRSIELGVVGGLIAPLAGCVLRQRAI